MLPNNPFFKGLEDVDDAGVGLTTEETPFWAVGRLEEAAVEAVAVERRDECCGFEGGGFCAGFNTRL